MFLLVVVAYRHQVCIHLWWQVLSRVLEVGHSYRRRRAVLLKRQPCQREVSLHLRGCVLMELVERPVNCLRLHPSCFVPRSPSRGYLVDSLCSTCCFGRISAKGAVEAAQKAFERAEAQGVARPLHQTYRIAHWN